MVSCLTAQLTRLLFWLAFYGVDVFLVLIPFVFILFVVIVNWPFAMLSLEESQVPLDSDRDHHHSVHCYVDVCPKRRSIHVKYTIYLQMSWTSSLVTKWMMLLYALQVEASCEHPSLLRPADLSSWEYTGKALRGIFKNKYLLNLCMVFLHILQFPKHYLQWCFIQVNV